MLFAFAVAASSAARLRPAAVLAAQPDGDATLEALIARADAARTGLRVPYFMPEGKINGVDFDAAWKVLSACATLNVTDAARSRVQPDFAFIASLRSSPWRVKREADAEIIIVPVATFDLIEQECVSAMSLPYVMSDDGAPLCPGYDGGTLLDALTNTSLFQRRSHDHLLVAAHDYAATWRTYTPRGQTFLDVMLATQTSLGGRSPFSGRYNQLVTPYGTGKLNVADWASTDRRPIRLFFGGGTAMVGVARSGWRNGTRLGYYVRDRLVQERATLPATLLVSSSDADATCVRSEGATCAEVLPECTNVSGVSGDVDATTPLTEGSCRGRYDNSVLGRAAMTLCPRGDNPSSVRVFEALAEGSVPVVIGRGFFESAAPFQCFVPWDELVVDVDEDDCMAGCADALARATGLLDSAALDRRRAALAHFSRDLLWAHPQSRVAENLLIEAASRFLPRSAAATAAAMGAACPFGSRLQKCDLQYDDEYWQCLKCGSLHRAIC